MLTKLNLKSDGLLNVCDHLTIIILQTLEAITFETLEKLFYARNGNDSFVIIKMNKQLNFNSTKSLIFLALQITMAKEKDAVRSHLGVLACRLKDGKLIAFIFQMATNSLTFMYITTTTQAKLHQNLISKRHTQETPHRWRKVSLNCYPTFSS